jgi:hypothetical protein
MVIRILLNKNGASRALWELPDDAPHYSVVGRIAAAWASLESTLDTEIYQLLGASPKKCACITAQMLGAAPRLKAIRALCELQGASKSLLGKLNEYLNKTYSIAERRNRVVHDPYFVDGSSGQVNQFETTANKKLNYGYKPTSLPEMELTLKEIREHHDRFILIIRKRIYDELRAPPDKRRQRRSAIHPDQAE